jgi:hypothetical protein
LNESLLTVVGFSLALAAGATVPALFFSRVLFFRTWSNLRAAAERDRQPVASIRWKITSSLPINTAAIVLVPVFGGGVLRSLGLVVVILIFSHFRPRLSDSLREYFVRISHWRFALLNNTSVVCSLAVSLVIFQYVKSFA